MRDVRKGNKWTIKYESINKMEKENIYLNGGEEEEYR